MSATVTDLQSWKKSHPPILMLWNAQCRFLSAWVSACFKLAVAPMLTQIPNGDG